MRGGRVQANLPRGVITVTEAARLGASHALSHTGASERPVQA